MPGWWAGGQRAGGASRAPWCIGCAYRVHVAQSLPPQRKSTHLLTLIKDAVIFRALKEVGRNVWVTTTPLLSLLAERLLEDLGQDKNALHLQHFLTVLQMCIYYLDRCNYSFNMCIFIYIYAYIYSEKLL